MDLILVGYVSTHDPLLSLMGAFHNLVLPFENGWLTSISTPSTGCWNR